MKEKKPIAIMLTTIMLVSLCGCSDDKKGMLKAADEYAAAVSEFDCEEIAAHMRDETKAESKLSDLNERYESESTYAKAFDAIVDSMTYAVDKDSVKDGKEKVTYTFVDYEKVYKKVYDDGGDFNDYIEALEENGGKNTTEITQTIGLAKDNKEWRIKDKYVDDLFEIYKFIDEIPEYSWCNFITLTLDDFKDVMTCDFDVDIDELTVVPYDGYEEIDYNKGYLLFRIDIFDTPPLAQSAFEEVYDDLHVEGYSEESGMYTYYYNGSEGYILFNGEQKFEKLDYHMYGGVYIKDNMILIVISYSPYVYTDEMPAHRMVTDFLKIIGYPMPV